MDVAVTFGFSAVSYIHKCKGNLAKGRNLKEAGHVQRLLERAGIITAKVIRQTSINLPAYDVKITIDCSRKVVAAECTCIAGVSGHCKHISATIIAVNEEESTTKTSLPCEWKQPSVSKVAKEKYSKGKRWHEIFGSRENSKMFPPVNISMEMVNFKVPSMLPYMLHEEQSTSVIKRSESSIRILSNIQLNPPSVNDEFQNIQLLIKRQYTNTILEKLYREDIYLMSDCCISTYNKKLPCNAVDVCLRTMKDKNLWLTERKFRITASRAYHLYTYNGNDWLEKAKKYFCQRSFSNKYTEHGIAWESEARFQYSKDNNCKVVETGLVVCQTDPWLAVSPDGIVFYGNTPTKLLEIKCPFIGKTVSAETIEEHCSYLKRERGKLILKPKHSYYAQVQLNMAVLGLSNCDFVLFCSTDKTYKIVNVPFDEEFAKNLMFKLKKIFFQNLLHILCDH